MTYRKDIQILRGLAVILVVFYHYGVYGFKSGFLGVDVFFVISGFLMSILYDPCNKLNFFKRRALRLLPAYFATIVFTVIAAIFITTPNEFDQVFTQALYADIFASNLGYWLQNSYFSNAEFNPLLHLWSLGVEIQFYLIVPLLFFLFNVHKAFFLVIFFTSLLLCLYMISISPKTSFFMMPLRLWEFLIGYGVGYYLIPNGVIKTRHATWLGSAGLLLILIIPLFNIDGQSLDFVKGHPGIGAMLISLATGLTLLYGIGMFHQLYLIGNILERIGKYSYSIYLVHFPVLVLFLYQPFSGTRIQIDSLNNFVLISIITAIFSYYLYYMFEVGQRSNRYIKKILFISPFFIASMAWTGSNVQQLFYTEKQVKISNAFSDRDVYRCGKMFRILYLFEKSCHIGEKNNSIENVLLVGNSHADSIKKSFVESANNNNTNVFFIAENTALMSEERIDAISRLTGGSMNEGDIVKEAIDKKINHIVLHYSYKGISANIIKSLVDKAYKHGIYVSFIMPIPTYKAYIPKMLWDIDSNKVRTSVQTKDDYQKHVKNYLEELKGINTDNFKIYSSVNYFCNKECAIQAEDGKPYYFDREHLTLTGARILQPLFTKILTNIR
jgi:peptidoglycan/LPS O-acetylase OafA/YrhL